MQSARETTVASTREQIACSNGGTGLQPYKTKAELWLVVAEQVKLKTNLASGRSTSQSPLVKVMKQ